MQAKWYFDFVSPFAYLHYELFHKLREDLEIVPIPVLFAGLLGHWGQKGPAEIPGKRLYTYRYCTWFAARNNIPFKMPAAHPFNPLPALRLAIALDNNPAAIATIFHFLWQDGGRLDDESDWAILVERLDAKDAAARVAEQSIKDRLRENTETAAAQGVFGVPSLIVDGELFWGVESLDMVNDYLKDTDLFKKGAMADLDELPSGADRRT